jgi:histidinol-phosphatase (PHP family)
MVREAVDPYLSEIARLRDIHGEQMQVWQSMEIDYLSRDFGPHIDYFQRLPLDYRLASVHFVPNYDGIPIDCDGRYERFSQRLKEEFRGDIRYVVEKFFEHTLTMIEFGGFDILGHFDLVTKFGYIDEEDPRYRSLALEVLDSCLEICPIAEMNTGAISRGYRKTPYPAPFILDRIKEKGGKIILSSDCHNKDYLLCHFDECLDTSRAHSFESIVALIGGKFTEIGIND